MKFYQVIDSGGVITTGPSTDKAGQANVCQTSNATDKSRQYFLQEIEVVYGPLTYKPAAAAPAPAPVPPPAPAPAPVADVPPVVWPI